MEPSTGFRASVWSCFKFLPFFCGLLLLGIIKGDHFASLCCPGIASHDIFSYDHRMEILHISTYLSMFDTFICFKMQNDKLKSYLSEVFGLHSILWLLCLCCADHPVILYEEALCFYFLGAFHKFSLWNLEVNTCCTSSTFSNDPMWYFWLEQ